MCCKKPFADAIDNTIVQKMWWCKNVFQYTATSKHKHKLRHDPDVYVYDSQWQNAKLPMGVSENDPPDLSKLGKDMIQLECSYQRTPHPQDVYNRMLKEF